MVTYKNKPGIVEEKEHYKHDYKLASAIKYDREDSANPGLPSNRFSASSSSIDHLVHTSTNDRLHKQMYEQHGHRQTERINQESSYKDYLTQPIWFYKVMDRLAELEAKDGKRENKQPAQKQLYLFLN